MFCYHFFRIELRFYRSCSLMLFCSHLHDLKFGDRDGPNLCLYIDSIPFKLSIFSIKWSNIKMCDKNKNSTKWFQNRIFTCSAVIHLPPWVGFSKLSRSAWRENITKFSPFFNSRLI